MYDLLNSSSIRFNHRTSDYGLAIEEAKDGKQKQGHEKKIAILPKIESYPFSEVEGIDQVELI